MPQAAKRPCRHPGCPNLVGRGYCQDHEAAAKKEKYQRFGSSTKRGYGYQHQKVRAQTLKRDNYLCQRCLEQGRITPATDSHHIVKMTTAPERHLDPSNRRSLCNECHRIEEKDAR